MRIESIARSVEGDAGSDAVCVRPRGERRRARTAGRCGSRGAYLARAADCAPCHTGNASQPFAGGLGPRTPFGTLFSVDITSDPETGIGEWTFDQFKNALHQGIRADGAYLYPGMPVRCSHQDRGG
jgi:hypothetical protein